MKETELERLVVKLEGNGTTYTRMVSEANAQNKSLVASLKQVEDSQKKLEEKIKQTSGAWKSNAIAINDSSSAMEKFNEHTKTSTSLFGQYVNSVKSGLTEIRGELLKVGVAYADAMSGGLFDSNKTALQRALARLNPATYVETAKAGAAGLKAGLATVVRDESTVSKDPSRFGGVRVDAKTRRVTESTAENEDYLKSLKPYHESVAKEEAARRRSLEMDDISALPNRGERVNAMKRVLAEAIREETLLNNETTVGGGGLLDEINRLEGDAKARSSAAYQAKLLGVKNPYEEMIGKKRAELTKRRAEALESSGRRRAATRAIEDVDRSFKSSDRSMIRGMEMDNATFGMSPDAARLHRMKAEGVHWSTISAVRGEMFQNRSNLHGKSLEDDERERSEVGMKPRDIRDKRVAEEMKKAGYTETQIQQQVASNKKTDEVKDKQELIDVTKEYVKALDSESKAMLNSRDSMQPYYDLVKKLDDAIAKETDATKKQELIDKRTGIKTSVAEHDKAGIVQRYGMSRSDQFKAEKKKLDDMRNDKTNPIDSDTYNRALADLSQSYRTSSSGSSPENRGVFSTSDPGEAYSRLIDFRERAFGTSGDTRGGPKARALRKSKSRQAALRRRRGVTVDELGDPTANMDFGSAGGSPQPDHKEADLLERIAKAVEKEAETKVETAGLK